MLHKCDIFISYPKEEREKARIIASRLNLEGYNMFMFVDIDKVSAYGNLKQYIATALSETRAVIFIYGKGTEISLLQRRECEYLIQKANSQGIPFIPIISRPVPDESWYKGRIDCFEQLFIDDKDDFTRLVSQLRLRLDSSLRSPMPICRPMGIDKQPSKPTSPVGNQNMPESESNTINTTQVLDYIPRPKGMSKTGATIGSTIGSGVSPIGVILSGISGWFCAKRINTAKYDNVYSSIFAPSEVIRKSRMQIQVYFHLYEETEKVKSLAQESDKRAERRDYMPLQCKLKKGDKVDALLNIYGETLLMSDKKSVVWQGSFTKCSFDYFVPKDIDVDELSCVALLTVNNIPVGEMRFITRIVESPRKLNPEIIAHKYNKVFISYAHKDEAKVKSFHEGLKLAGIEHFFDRAYLKTGDVFPQVIQDYIDSADLFVLFWSENAAQSDYVQKERSQALERAFPQVKPQQDAKLSIYPMSIEPRAELPSDMKENYHFGEI